MNRKTHRIFFNQTSKSDLDGFSCALIHFNFNKFQLKGLDILTGTEEREE